MYDAKAQRYRRCDRSSEGRCQQFGASCEPPGRCMFNPGDGLHHTCETVADGACKQFGPACDPT
jgi:hypothetical protein